MCTSGATRMGIDGVDSKVNGSGDSPLRAAHVFRVAAVLLRGLPNGRSRLSLQQGVEGSELKEKVESGNALQASGATRLVSSAPATSQTRARCELVDPLENDDRQSFTQQCPPTLRATGLFPIKGRFLRLLSASEGPLRESGEESSFSNKIQSRLAIDELISPINLGKWCGRVRAILTQNKVRITNFRMGILYQKQASANNARLCAIAARLLHSFEFLAVDHSPSDEGSALVVRPPRVRSSLVRPDTREDPASYSRLDLVVRRIRCAGGWVVGGPVDRSGWAP